MIACVGLRNSPHNSSTGRSHQPSPRNAELEEIGAGISEIRRMLIGREIFQETA
jgi:hypothetical protein